MKSYDSGPEIILGRMALIILDATPFRYNIESQYASKFDRYQKKKLPNHDNFLTSFDSFFFTQLDASLSKMKILPTWPPEDHDYEVL